MLLALKSEYKSTTGKDYQPKTASKQSVASVSISMKFVMYFFFFS